VKRFKSGKPDKFGSKAATCRDLRLHARTGRLDVCASRSSLSFSLLNLFTLLLFAFTLIIAAPFAARARSWREYKDAVVRVQEDFESLAYPDEDSTRGFNRSFEKEVVAEIPRLLPAQEIIKFSNSETPVDNRWLYEKIDLLKQDVPGTPQHSRTLTEIAMRLAAIKQKLDELDRAQAAKRGKYEDKQKLNEILRRAEYQKPETQQKSRLESIIDSVFRWLRNVFPEAPATEGSGEGFHSLSYALQILIIAVVLGLLAFLAYRILPTLRRRIKSKASGEAGDRVILGETLDEDTNSRDLFAEADALARAGDIRAAIRKGYIALLCDLSDRKIIGLAKNKTNRDYLRDVRANARLYENMNELTGSFEQHWYGRAEADEKSWEDFRMGYRKTVES
jgi:Domain of unknown function (DUF4129)